MIQANTQVSAFRLNREQPNLVRHLIRHQHKLTFGFDAEIAYHLCFTRHKLPVGKRAINIHSKPDQMGYSTYGGKQEPTICRQVNI